MKIIKKNNGWLIEPDTSDEHKCLEHIFNVIGRAYESNKVSGSKDFDSTNQKHLEYQSQSTD